MNEFNGPHVAAEGYRFAFTSVQIKFITATPLAQTVQIPLKQLAIPDALYRHKKLQIVMSAYPNTLTFSKMSNEFGSQVTLSVSPGHNCFPKT
jgi:hypothetical protein